MREVSQKAVGRGKEEESIWVDMKRVQMTIWTRFFFDELLTQGESQPSALTPDASSHLVKKFHVILDAVIMCVGCGMHEMLRRCIYVALPKLQHVSFICH